MTESEFKRMLLTVVDEFREFNLKDESYGYDLIGFGEWLENEVKKPQPKPEDVHQEFYIPEGMEAESIYPMAVNGVEVKNEREHAAVSNGWDPQDAYRPEININVRRTPEE